jgi:hypothetical protein
LEQNQDLTTKSPDTSNSKLAALPTGESNQIATPLPKKINPKKLETNPRKKMCRKVCKKMRSKNVTTSGVGL